MYSHLVAIQIMARATESQLIPYSPKTDWQSENINEYIDEIFMNEDIDE